VFELGLLDMKVHLVDGTYELFLAGTWLWGPPLADLVVFVQQ